MNKNILTELAKDVYQLTLFFPAREPLRYKLREVADEIIVELIMEKNDYLGNIGRYLEVIYSYFDIASSQDWVSPVRISQIKDNYLLAAQKLTEMELAQEIAKGNSIKDEEEYQESEKEAGMNSRFIEVSEEVKIETAGISSKDLMEAKIPATPMVVELVLDKIEIEPANAVKEETLAAFETVRETVPAEKDIESAGGEEDEEKDDEKEESSLSEGQIVRQNRIVEYLKENGNAQVWEILKIFPAVSKRTIRRDFRSMLKQGLIERTGERNTTAYKLKITLS
jgi:hypothetical protein